MFSFELPMEIKKKKEKEYIVAKKKLKPLEKKKNEITMAKIMEDIEERWPHCTTSQEKVNAIEIATTNQLPLNTVLKKMNQKKVEMIH